MRHRKSSGRNLRAESLENRRVMAADVGCMGGMADLAAMTPEERATALFTKLDADASGTLETSELTEKLAEKLAGSDTDGDNLISSSEFNEFITSRATAQEGRPGGRHHHGRNALTAAQIADKIFAKHDVNDDSTLSQETDGLSDKQWARIAAADADNNGIVTVEELTNHIESKKPNSNAASQLTLQSESPDARHGRSRGRRS